MNSLTVYDYTCPRQFLLDCLGFRQKREPGFSMRAWAREMGLGSNTLLVMLLQGKRPLRVKHVSFLSKGISLSSHEQLYLQALIQYQSAPTLEEKQLCSLWLADLNPGKGFKTKELDEFLMISHWVHTAILSMTSLTGFDGNEKTIHRLLKGRVSIAEIRAAIERLIQLELLIRKPDGGLEFTFQRLTTKNDVANVGARKYHKQVMDLAKEAIEQVPLEMREFQSFSIAVSKEKIPLAKEMIRKFRAQFAKAIASDSGDEVFQFNLQFFQLTEGPARSNDDFAQDEGVDTENHPQIPKGEVIC